MSSVIDNIVNDKQDVKNQLGDIPDVIPVIKVFNTNLEKRHVASKFTKVTYSGSTGGIFGSSTFGIFGTATFGSPASTDTLKYVISPENVFIEYFGQDLFIDSGSSTGTLNTTSETYALDAGEVLQSTVVQKLGAPITAVKLQENLDIDTSESTMLLGSLSLGTSVFGGNSSIYVSNDGGSNWYSLSEDTIYTFASNASTDEFKYKIVANDNFTISHPIEFWINP